MSTAYSELYRHLKSQFGHNPFSRESAEILASRCGELSEAINQLIDDGHLEIHGTSQQLALTEAQAS